jgi:hypothetical protein
MSARELQFWVDLQAVARDLQSWLQHEMARGLESLDVNDWYERMPPRLEAAKAPLVALWIQNAQADVRRARPRWKETLLKRVGLMQHLCDRLLRPEPPVEWPVSERDLLRTVVGHDLSDTEVSARGTPLEDSWLVMSIRKRYVATRLPIAEHRIWLWGQSGQQFAWVSLTFRTDRPHPIDWQTGQLVSATLVPQPGGATLRAFLREHQPVDGEAQWPLLTTEASWQRLAARLQINPWSELEPLILREVRIDLSTDGQPPQAVTPQGSLPLLINSGLLLDLFKACAAGMADQPMHLMGEWNGHELVPVSAWRNNALCWQNVSEF